MTLSRVMLALLTRTLLARLLLTLLAWLLSAAALLLSALATLAGLLLLLTRTRVVLLVRILIGIGHSRCSSWVVEAIAPTKIQRRQRGRVSAACATKCDATDGTGHKKTVWS
jgi:hypothetical protein